jgi:hypothetical protein
VPRPKSPEGKHVTMSARFTEAEAALIDEARGTDDRNTWIRRVALAAVSGSARKPPEKRGGSIAPARVPPVPVSDRPPKAPPAARTGCPHRLPPGAFCKTCGQAK